MVDETSGTGLAGKVAILTGAAGGQGRILARLFAEAGARIVLGDIESWEETACGPDAISLRHDVTSEADWDAVVKAAVERFGSIDILVNNAGVAGYDTIETLTPEQLQRYLTVNLHGALLGIQAVLPWMRQRGGGAVVNVASTAALRGSRGLAGYGISKWGLRGLSRCAAQDLAPYGIRVNCVLPGAVDVVMVARPGHAEAKRRAASQTPLGRLARAEEIARTVLFLASDAASYMTGAELVVDGGLSA